MDPDNTDGKRKIGFFVLLCRYGNVGPEILVQYWVGLVSDGRKIQENVIDKRSQLDFYTAKDGNIIQRYSNERFTSKKILLLNNLICFFLDLQWL